MWCDVEWNGAGDGKATWSDAVDWAAADLVQWFPPGEGEIGWDLHNMPSQCFSIRPLHPVGLSRNLPYVGNIFGSSQPHIAATPPPPPIHPEVPSTGTNELSKLGWQVSAVKILEWCVTHTFRHPIIPVCIMGYIHGPEPCQPIITVPSGIRVRYCSSHVKVRHMQFLIPNENICISAKSSHLLVALAI